ncbi:MAG TPA: preprotein translocase subunit SecE [Methylomirabilota bacterium]|jgi:preprotein translocase subunit SecE|nr:preprotein translocase subunit SecE [Methylomirabilota bacterium]
MAVLVQGIKDGIETARTFVQEAWAELRRVQWPTRNEIRAATIVVILLVGAVSLFLFFVDSILSWLLHAFLGS